MAGAGALLIGGVSWIVLSGAADRVVVGTRAKAWDLSAQAGFSVQNILVEGRGNSDADVLRAVLGLERGDPILAFNPAEAKDLIERISWVKEAHVERRFPDTIYIGLVERTPMALWQHKGKVRVVDDEGVTLTDALRHKFDNLPIIVGEEAPVHARALIAILAAEPTVKDQVEAATWVSNRRWDLKLRNGVTVQLPENDAGLALRRLAAAHDEDDLMDRDITLIDLRDSGRITVRTRPGAVEEYKKRQEEAARPGDNI